jgi:hypothetical protein
VGVKLYHLKRRLRVFEKRVLKRMFEPKRQGGDNYIMNCSIIYTQQNIIGMIKLRMMRCARRVVCMGEIDCSLFNDALSSSEYIASNDRRINE